MALKGSLRDFSTTQVLNLISLARKTGTLTVEGSQVAHMSFREGKLIDASLGESSNSLAYVLQKAGILTEDQGRIIQTRAVGTSDRQLGHLLVQAGYVTQSDIIQSVRNHILDVVFKLFTWVDGLFRFDATNAFRADRITVPIDLESVIMEGSRRLREWEYLQDEIPSLDMSLKFSDRPDARLRNINLTVEEWRVVSFVNPNNSLEQIAKATNLNEFEIRRIAFGMLQAGLVEVAQGRLVEAVPVNGTPVQKRTEEQPPQVKRSVITRLIDRIKRL